MANKRITINFGTILKRSNCLNSTNESVDCNKRFDNLIKILENNKDGSISPSVKNSLYSYIESLCDLNNASKYYRNPLFIIQELNQKDINFSNYILNEYVSRVLPYVQDLSYINESVERYSLSDDQKEKIIESVIKLNIADRILLNHDKISKRFNIVAESSKVKSKGLKYVVDSCCSMIDTYTIEPYAKFNLCLEEMGYVFDKEGIQYDKKEFVKFVTEYFLLRSPNISSRDLKGYKVVLNENCYIVPGLGDCGDRLFGTK